MGNATIRGLPAGWSIKGLDLIEDEFQRDAILALVDDEKWAHRTFQPIEHLNNIKTAVSRGFDAKTLYGLRVEWTGDGPPTALDSKWLLVSTDPTLLAACMVFEHDVGCAECGALWVSALLPMQDVAAVLVETSGVSAFKPKALSPGLDLKSLAK